MRPPFVWPDKETTVRKGGIFVPNGCAVRETAAVSRRRKARNTASGAWKVTQNPISEMEEKSMAFFNSAVTVLQTLVVALGAGLGIWGAINLLEGYGNDNPGANAHVR